MREMTLPESGAKRKLLDAAEQLFADKGFEAVSVRDITELAKTNVAAVNYHFGSRDALLTLVMMRSMLPVTEERIARLDALEKKMAGKAAPLEEIVDAMVRPLITQVRKSELNERLFYKLIGRIITQQGDGLPNPIEEQLKQVVDRFTRAFAMALPSLDQENLVWRIHFMAGGMIHMLSHQDVLYRLTNGAAGAPTMEATLSRFIRFAVAGLTEGIGSTRKKQKVEEVEAIEEIAHAEVIAGEEIPAGEEAVVEEVPVKKTPQGLFDF